MISPCCLCLPLPFLLGDLWDHFAIRCLYVPLIFRFLRGPCRVEWNRRPVLPITYCQTWSILLRLVIWRQGKREIRVCNLRPTMWDATVAEGCMMWQQCRGGGPCSPWGDESGATRHLIELGGESNTAHTDPLDASTGRPAVWPTPRSRVRLEKPIVV
jgi:hypothetical protein